MNQILHLYLLVAQLGCLVIFTTICESLFELETKVLYICLNNDILEFKQLQYRFSLFNVERYESNILFVLIRNINLLFKQFKKSLEKFDSNYTRKALYICLKNDMLEFQLLEYRFYLFNVEKYKSLLHLCSLEAQSCCLDILTTICQGLFELVTKKLYISLKNDMLKFKQLEYRFSLFKVENINKIFHLYSLYTQSC